MSHSAAIRGHMPPRFGGESGKAAGLSRSKLRLSKWAEEYERVQGKIRCPQRERNNARRGQGKRVQDRVSRPTGRHRREEMSPQREQRQAIPAGRDGWGGPERVAWQRAEERGEWEQLQRRCGKALGELEKRSKREWSALYGRHQQQREYLAKAYGGISCLKHCRPSDARLVPRCSRSCARPGPQGRPVAGGRADPSGRCARRRQFLPCRR